MAVRVRCRGCEKVLNLPDKARGRTIRCPGCSGPVKVPSGESGTGGGRKSEAPSGRKPAAAGARRGRKTREAGGEDIFANLDLSGIADEEARVCPRCGEEVPEEQFECPVCGVDIRTGKLSERAARKRARKGPDPAEFYSGAFADGFAFLKANRMLAVRTAIYELIFVALACTFAFLTVYFYQVPLKIFFGLLTAVFAFGAPGWLWFLYLEVLEGSLGRKKKLKRVRFDFFLNVALGLKAISWLLFFSVPIVLLPAGVGGYLMYEGNTIVGAVLIGVGFLPVLMMVPIGLCHMVMPVTMPGWLSPKVAATFFQKATGPALYWLMVFLVTMLPALGMAGAAIGVSYQDLERFIGDVQYNAEIDSAKATVAARVKNEELDASVTATAEQKPRELDWGKIGLPGGLLAGACIFLGALVVVPMRVNGQILHYFRNNLDLVKYAKEIKYEAKSEAEQIDLLKNYNTTPMIVGLFTVMASIALLIFINSVLVLTMISIIARKDLIPWSVETIVPAAGTIAMILGLVGRSFCMTVPKETGVRDTIMICLVFDGLVMALNLTVWLDVEFVQEVGARILVFFVLIGWPFLFFALLLALSYGGTVVFLNAMVGLAGFARRLEVADKALFSRFIIACIWSGFMFLAFIPNWVLSKLAAAGQIIIIGFAIAGGAMILALLLYVIVLWQLIQAFKNPADFVERA
ncbi:MAG: hypothetical protein KY476_21615 [Planctomycetes bacterium]|nr:hypothetical protein [Planctomycetota bacterium]